MARKVFLYTFALGALVLFVSTGVFFGLQYSETMEEAYDALQGEASYAVNGLEAGGLEYLRSLENINRITWIDPAGEVLYDSAYPDLSANQGGFQEVRQALEEGSGQGIRRSSSGGVRTMYFAVRCRDGTVLRLSRPLSAVRYAFLAVTPILWTVVLVLLVSAMMAFRIANTIAGPINGMDLDGLPQDAPYPELQPLVERLAEQREMIGRQTRERERMRREFTANVSHELKTPLTSISGFAELMRGGLCDEEKMVEFAGDIYRESQRLIVLVNDILHLSELDEMDGELGQAAIPGTDTATAKNQEKAGSPDLALFGEFCETDLFEIAKATAARLRPEAEKSRLSLTVTGESQTVYGSARILEEMAYNLCDNAIKYNREGGSVTIRVGAGMEARTEKKSVFFTVEDTGIGIPREEQERIFERFYRVDKSHSRQIGGTGLGLSIVRHGARLHGAEIGVDSAPGKGSRITLRFPGALPAIYAFTASVENRPSRLQ